MKNYKRSFRFVCAEDEHEKVGDLLKIQGFTWDNDTFTKNACRLIDEPFSLGLSLAAFFGLIYIQDRASMLPPLALNPPKGAFVLDMCASPGSKTGQVSTMVGEKGFVIGNEPSPSRLATLRRNLQQMNLLQSASSCYNGQSIKLPHSFFEYIQLDPPCSGWGTIERNPNVMDMWKEDKTLPLIRLQKELLQEAYRLLKPDGVMVYSTCTTHVEENEKQVLFAQELGFVLEELPELQEFVLDPPLLGLEGVWRLSPRIGDAQGFFVARFRKKHEQKENLKKEDDSNEKINQEHQWGTVLSKKDVEDLGIDTDILNYGDICIFGESVHFIAHRAKALPHDFLWQGMYMGKVSRNGDIAISPRLRIGGSLPKIFFEGEEGIIKIKGLLAGQSIDLKELSLIDMDIKGKNKNALFYWNNLLLGRLKIKNKRVLWTER